MIKFEEQRGTSLSVQWLTFHASTVGDLGSIPGQGNKILRLSSQTTNNKKGQLLKNKEKCFYFILFYFSVSVLFIIEEKTQQQVLCGLQ